MEVGRQYEQMTSRFLITTAEECTWRTDQPVLFLGEWCRLNSRREIWSKLDAQVLPYHWDDRAKLLADYAYLSGLYEQLLEDLSVQLNQLHGVDHSVRYWRILVGPWLGYFVQMLFDRWTSIQQAVSQYELSETIVLSGREDRLVPNDTAEFTRLFVDDAWNHHVYAAVLQQFTSVRCRKLARAGLESPARVAARAGWKTRVKMALVTGYARVASALSRDRDAFFVATYLPLRDEMRMHVRFGQVPQLWYVVPPVRAAIAGSQRQWTLRGSSRSTFEICLRGLIPQHLPTVFLEGYAELVKQTQSLQWPKRPRVIWTSNAHIYDDVFKAWTAGKVEDGVPLVISQHGGHYGMGRWSFLEDHELAVSDRYLSWGWTEPRQSKVTPVGQLKDKRPLKVRHTEQAHALLVTCTLPRFSYWMYSAFLAGQWLDYFNDQCDFVTHLPQRIQAALIVRLYFKDYDWDQAARWRERFPHISLDVGRRNINKLVRQSRLYISTYNATTYLESFTMDVPTVVYWNERHWELRESAGPYFDELKRVGIFHATPRAAAEHVAAVWDDVDSWWRSPHVRVVLDRFKRRYCDQPSDRLDRVEHALRAVDADAEPTRLR